MELDALELLRSDHERVAALFDQIELAQDTGEKLRLFDQIRQELELHAYIEEKVLYPYFARRHGFEQLVRDSYDEHQEVRILLQEVASTASESERDEKIADLIDAVEHHVREEEEDFFPRIEKAVDTVQLMQLAAELEEAKKVLPAAA